MNKSRLLISAFTLIEILLVIVLMAILAAVVIPRGGGGALFERFTVYTVAHQIASDMRYARRLAITTGVKHRVKFFKVNGSSDYNEYRIQIDGWSDVGVVKAISDDVVVSGDRSVVFKITGESTNNRNFTYVLGSHEYDIAVKKQTGRVKLEED
ncbi:MAG: prepilin-type N-terminal cleavage/methylation domain-containing protein [Candidatus Omnitrophica bacterium]|nr:prepilin-type N-terminal cleavage/methylation domain-containing protein [Candidatus Omnitrophota bacterium]